MTPSFKVGDIVSNSEITEEFRCSPQGGMRRSKTTGTLVITTKKGLYDDRWDGDVLYYTGMGQEGDQSLYDRQNKTLAESRSNGVEVHLFEVFRDKEYTYRGVVELAADPFYEQQPDSHGSFRKVCIFPVRLRTSGQSVALSALKEHEADIQHIVSKLSDIDLESKAKERGTSKPSNRTTYAVTIERDQFVAEYTKRRAGGKCDLCGHTAPFKDLNGRPYLECHHIVWLAKGGSDTIDNTAALCPNCHRKMHVLNDHQDVELLKSKYK